MAKSPAASAVSAASKAAANKKAAVAAKAKPIAAQAIEPVEIHEEQRIAERRANSAMQFAVQQLSTPVAQPALVAPQMVDPKMAEFQAAMAAKAAELGISLPTVNIKAVRAAKDTKNNITRPAANTKCGKIWAACDAISAAQANVPAQISQLKLHGSVAGINEHTIKTQYARWRGYNGVVGRAVTIAPVVQEERAPWAPSFGQLSPF